MFTELSLLGTRPAPFCTMTTADLWTDPHTSAQMLSFHLDGNVDASSRTSDVITRTIAWLTGPGGVGPGTRVLDLGCGPGLTANPLVAAGATVTGVDFSTRSIAYARDHLPDGPGTGTYVHGDYLTTPIDGTFDVALMIMCDYCALSPAQRSTLLTRLTRLLVPGGRFVFDVHGTARLREHPQGARLTHHPEGGFWSPQPYVELVHSFVYPDARVTLDKYDLFEANRERHVYNWLQCFDAATVTAELDVGGFDVVELMGDLTGAPRITDEQDFAVVAALRPDLAGRR